MSCQSHVLPHTNTFNCVCAIGVADMDEIKDMNHMFRSM